MGRITTNVGLITGFPIAETVEELVALQAVPRDNLQERNNALQEEQVAVTQLTAMLIAIQTSSNRLAQSSLYSQRQVTSSQESIVAATLTGSPALGSYQVTPLRLARAQQFQSTGLASASTALGAGTLTIRRGGYVDQDVSLDLIGGGAGLAAGKIRITDRSGATADIDLSQARSIDDVLEAINSNAAVSVRAEAVGDRLRLVDLSGATALNLKVQEVGGGTTAASLGLAGIDVAASQAEGSDIFRLFDGFRLDQINDSRGVRFDSVLADLKLTFRDGTETEIDLAKRAIAGTKARATVGGTVGPNSKFTVTAVEGGAAFAGVAVTFEDDPTVTAGSERVLYDAETKRLTFKIDLGRTTAKHAVAALNADEDVKKLFTASLATGTSGAGLVVTTDGGITAGPQSTATTPGTLSSNAKIVFNAVQGGPAFDGVTLSFVDNPNITAGGETVVYDGSDPNNKRLTFQIDAGVTTADQVIAALNNDAAARQVLTAARAPGSSGAGLVSVSDSVTTAGGAFVEPVPGTDERTIGDILAALNAAAPGKLEASLDAAGDRIVLTDLTTGGGTFSATSLNDSHAAEDLGLAGAALSDTISSRRLAAGLKTTLVASLNGGRGYGDLGLVDITDRSGATATVDLAGAETLDDILERIKAAGVGVQARVNTARNGILLEDTTGQTSGNLIVADGDASETATRLGIAVDAAVSSQSSGDLHRQTVNENTLLSTLNGGAGVAAGTLRITNTLGATKTLTLSQDTKTFGDVIRAIENLGPGIHARINDTGDGILLVDTAGGAQTFKVEEGNSTTAADLRLLGAAINLVEGETTRQAIDGSTTVKITLDGDDVLADLVARINDANVGASAAVLNDGSSVAPFRLSVINARTGRDASLLIDASQLGFDLTETVRAQDALVRFGVGADGAGGILASSATNTFKDLIDGVSVDIKSTSTSEVTITVGSTSSDLTTTITSLVDSYNRLVDKIDELTAFDEASGESALLQGDGTLLRVESDLTNLLTRPIRGAGQLGSLAAIGLSLDAEGHMVFDGEKFAAKLAESPQAVQDLLSKKEFGLSDRFKRVAEQLAGVDNSLLVNRAATLGRRITTNNEKIEFYNERLEATRELLLAQFQRMETAIAKIQANLTYLDQLAQAAALYNSNSSQ